MSLPTISVVTPTLNRAHFLGEAIESVRAQNYPNVEFIVVDGMSSDGTMDLLATYPDVRVIREPDDGLYDAINKGIRAGKGDFIALLNSDDLFPPNLFHELAQAFSDPQIEAVYGRAEIFQDDANQLASDRFAAATDLSRDGVDLTFKNVTIGSPQPNARFFRRSVFDRVGYFDLDFPLASDREFLFRIVLDSPRPVLLDRIVYRYRWHSGSITFSDNKESEAKIREEYLAVAERYLVRPDLPAEARRCCRLWHERESAQAATRALLAAHPSRFMGYVRRGMRENTAWPVMFARHLGGALLGR